jgi:hypothetical protein
MDADPRARLPAPLAQRGDGGLEPAAVRAESALVPVDPVAGWELCRSRRADFGIRRLGGARGRERAIEDCV